MGVDNTGTTKLGGTSKTNKIVRLGLKMAETEAMFMGIASRVNRSESQNKNRKNKSIKNK